MFCLQCGEKMPDNSKFCIKCGTKISVDGVAEVISIEEPVKVHSQPNVPQPQSDNRKKLGIIALVVALPIIGVIAFFALRSGAEDEYILADATTIPDYIEQIDAAHIETSTNVEPQSPTIGEVEWMTITNTGAEFTFTIPSSWSYSYGEWDSIRVSGEGVGGTISMVAGPIPADAIVGQIEDSTSRQEILFVNSHSGFMLEFDDRDSILWVDKNSELMASLYHGGNRSIFIDNEDTILQIVRSLTSTSTTAQVAEVAWLDLDMWSGFATISIPHAWYYSFEEQGPFTFWNITGVGARGAIVNMTVWESTLGDLNMHLDNARYSQFVFNDMHNGYMFEFPDVPDWDTNISWLRMDSGILVSLNHDGNRSIFTDNEDIILQIARSLTTVTVDVLQDNIVEVDTSSDADISVVGFEQLTVNNIGIHWLFERAADDVALAFGETPDVWDVPEQNEHILFFSDMSFIFDYYDRNTVIQISFLNPESTRLNQTESFRLEMSEIRNMFTVISEGYEFPWEGPEFYLISVHSQDFYLDFQYDSQNTLQSPSFLSIRRR